MNEQKYTTCPRDCKFKMAVEISGVTFSRRCTRYDKNLYGGSKDVFRHNQCTYDEGICPNCGRKGTYHKSDIKCSVHAETWVCDACRWSFCYDEPRRVPEPLGV